MVSLVADTPVKSVLLDEGESFVHADGKLIELANDNGYAFHKLAAWVEKEDGTKVIKTACIPSRAKIGRVNVSATSGSSSGLFEVNGTYYTVGANVPEPESMRSSSYAFSELNNVLVANSIASAGLSGEKIRVATGLPLKQYFSSDGDVHTKGIDRVKNSLQKLAQQVGADETISISKHEVLAESLAAFLDWAITDKGEVIQSIENGILVIDVGCSTTDISAITPENEIYIPGSDTKRIGILDVFKKLKSLLSSRFEIDEEYIHDQMLDKALRNNVFKVRGQSHDCKEQVDEAKRFVAKRLHTYIDELVTETLDNIIFVGGGAEALREQLLNLDEFDKDFVIIPEEPQFANVRGMLKFMTFIDSQ